jgi:hypothetical protein
MSVIEPTHYERMSQVLGGRQELRQLIHEFGRDGANVDDVWKIAPLIMGEVPSSELVGLPPSKVREYLRLVRPDWASSVHLEIQKYLLDHQVDKYSMSELYTSSSYYRLSQHLKHICGSGAASSTLHMNYQWISHERAGKRVFQVSPGLADQLRHTEIRGIMAEDIQLPYESIYIQVPQEAGLKIWNEQTQWHRVVGVYITEDHCMEIKDAYTISDKPGDKRGWRVLVIGEDKAKDTRYGDDAMAFSRVLLHDDMRLTDIIDLAFREMREWERVEGSSQSPKLSSKWEENFRWYLNVVLYITWQEPGEHWIANKEARQLWNRIQKTASKKKRKALNKKFQKLDPKKRIRLGSGILIDRKRPKSAPENSGQNGGSRKIEPSRIMTRVVGHWKHVPYGPMRKQRRYQWIEPYWRNKDGLAPEQLRHHVVK